MSIETRIPQQDINIKQLNLEQPEQDEVHFDEDKILSPGIVAKFKEYMNKELQETLQEPDAEKRTKKLCIYGNGLIEAFALSSEKFSDMANESAVETAELQTFKEYAEQNKWNHAMEELLYFIFVKPKVLQQIKLSEDQHSKLREYFNETKQKAIANDSWDGYLIAILAAKHLYPDDPSKQITMEPQELEKFQKYIKESDERDKLSAKVLAPDLVPNFQLPLSYSQELYKDLSKAAKANDWGAYREAALKLKIADAEEVQYTEKGLEIKLKAKGIQGRNSSIPEVKKF